MSSRPSTDIYAETLAVFERTDDPFEPLTTPEVAEALDANRRTVYKRLEKLVERGELRTKGAGSRARVWWRSDVVERAGAGGREAPPPDDATEASRRAVDVRERRPRAFTDAVGGYAVVTLDPDGRVRSRNEEAARIQGYEEDEIVGEHVSTFYTTDDREAGLPGSHVRAAIEDGSVEDEGWRVRSDGTTFRACVTLTAIFDDDGDLDGFVDVTHDLTARRAQGRRLRLERDLVERVLDVTPVSLGVVAPDGSIAQANAYVEDSFDRADTSADEYTIGDWNLYVDGEIVPVEDRPYMHVFETGEPTYDWECRVELPTGERRWLSISAVPLHEDGEVTRVVACAEDVTQFKEQARRLERQRDELKAELDDVFGRVSDGFLGLDTDQRLIYVNERAEALLGRSERELLGVPIWDAFEPEPIAREALDEVLETQEPTTYTVFYDPLGIWVEATVYPSETGLSVYFRDVTERKEREEELERSRKRFKAVFDESFDAMIIADDDGNCVDVNRAGSELFDRPKSELAGGTFERFTTDEYDFEAEWLAFQSSDDGRGQFPFRLPDGSIRIAEYGATAEILPGRHLSILRDVTDAVERERELERYETIVETVGDGVYAVDEEGRFVLVNEAYCELTGWDRDDLLGLHASTIHDERTNPRARRLAAEVDSGDREVATFESEIVTRAGDRIPAESRLQPLPVDGGLGRCGVVRDVTERKARKRELEQYEHIVETVPDGVYALDSEDRFTLVNDAYCEMIGYDRADLIGEHATIVTDHSINEAARQLVARMREGELQEAVLEVDLTRADGTAIPVESRFSQYAYDDDEARCGVVRDVTEREERERALAESERRYRTLVDNFPNGVVALFDEDLRHLTVGGRPFEAIGRTPEEIEGAVPSEFLPDDVVAQIEPHFRAVFEGETSEFEVVFGDSVRTFHAIPVTDEDGEVVAGMGMSQDVTDRKARERAMEESESRYRTLVEHFPNGIVTLFDEEFRYLVAGGELLETFGTSARSIEGTTLYEHTAPEDVAILEPMYRAALEGNPSTAETEYDGRTVQLWTVPVTDDDGEVFAGMAMSQDITRMRERERKLEAQRHRLATLNHLDRVVRDITHAVIEQSTREEIERTVCESLAESPVYEFAWIAELDPQANRVVPRVEAGVEGYLDEWLAHSIDPDHVWSEGPVGRAVRSNELEVTEDVFEESNNERWHEHAREHGYRSVAAIPIGHEKSMYGVLGLYASGPDAFEDEAREIVGQLGDVVGHAIAAAERKKALMADDVVELQFHVREFFDALDVPVSMDGQITFDRTATVGDDVFLAYGSAVGDGIDALEALVEGHPEWESVSVIDRSGDRTQFVARVARLPIVSIANAQGGYLEQSVIEGNETYVTVRLPTSVDVREIVETIREDFPTLVMVARRQISRSPPSLNTLQNVLTEGMTERQRSTLVAAFHAGFFDTPRKSSGEDVARSLGIGTSTFHEHLRAAEYKLVHDVVTNAHHEGSLRATS